MACQKYRDWSPKAETLQLVADCNDIIDELSEYRLTLRQLYYQLVSRNIIRNTDKSYARLSRVLTNARYAGLVDWDAIEDRVRQPDAAPDWNTVQELVESAIASYRLPRWEGQDTYCELWVEKDALASVLKPLSRKYHVTLMVNRGYSSASAMKASADRFLEAQELSDNEYLELCLFYLGDLDPSGQDMVRDIRDRLYEFGVDVNVEKIALTYAQVQQYNPPPNPAKLTDSRAPAFVAKYGRYSWEVDALPPAVLSQIITDAIENVLDLDMMNEVIDRENVDTENLRKAVENL